MLKHQNKPLGRLVIYALSSVFALSVMAFGQAPETEDPPPAQNPQSASPGWRRFSAPASPPDAPSAPQTAAPRPAPRARMVPERITIPAGTFVTVRVDQLLSSDKNKPGDSFSATLSRPLVAAGLVVARRGETLGGTIVDAKKAGRVTGVSHLQIALNSLTLADGHQVPIETELTNITGTTSKTRDGAAIAATTVTGAAIGGAAAWGPGAAIGGGAGLIAGTVGVLVTRGRPTVIYPESQLTFRLADRVTFSTDRAPEAFASAASLNNQRASTQGPPPPANCSGPGCAPYPSYYYGPGPYYPYYPYYPYWGPSVGFYFGPGFYGRGFYRR